MIEEKKRTVQQKVTTNLLLILNIALILPITLMIKLEKPTDMGLIPAIAMAVYTTYKFQFPNP